MLDIYRLQVLGCEISGSSLQWGANAGDNAMIPAGLWDDRWMICRALLVVVLRVWCGSFLMAVAELMLMLANQLLSVRGINLYVVGIFMYNYVTQKLPQIFENYCQRNGDVSDLNTNDFTYHSADFRYEDSVLRYMDLKCGIHLQYIYIKISTSLKNFKKKLRKYLIEKFAGNCEPILKVHAYVWYYCLCICVCVCICECILLGEHVHMFVFLQL